MLRAALVSVNNGTLHFGRPILQIANGAQSPTYLSTLEHSPKSCVRTIRVGIRRKNIVDTFFLLQVPFIDRGQNVARI